MSEIKLRKNPQTGETFFWAPGESDWQKVQARKNPDTGEAFILREGGQEWEPVGIYDTPKDTRDPQEMGTPDVPGGIRPGQAPREFPQPERPDDRFMSVQRPDAPPQRAPQKPQAPSMGQRPASLLDSMAPPQAAPEQPAVPQSAPRPATPTPESMVGQG